MILYNEITARPRYYYWIVIVMGVFKMHSFYVAVYTQCFTKKSLKVHFHASKQHTSKYLFGEEEEKVALVLVLFFFFRCSRLQDGSQQLLNSMQEHSTMSLKQSNSKLYKQLPQEAGGN